VLMSAAQQTEGRTEMMTEEQLERDYIDRACAAIRAGASCSIDYGLPWVSVTQPGGTEYFFQESEASDLLESVPDWIDEHTYIIAVSQGW